MRLNPRLTLTSVLALALLLSCARAPSASVEDTPYDSDIAFDDPSIDLDVSRYGLILPPGNCPPTDTALFPWPPPEPTDRVRLDPRWFGTNINSTTAVSEVADAIQRALRTVGHMQVGYQLIGCDGFAVISVLERIDSQGRPLQDNVRFLPPGTKERWSLTGYLTRLLSAPEGKYRQIVIIGTDKDWLGFDDPPTTAEVLAMMDDGSERIPDILDDYLWRERHRLTALIYEFDRPAGNGDPVHVPPRGLGGVLHLSGAGLYNPRNE